MERRIKITLHVWVFCRHDIIFQLEKYVLTTQIQIYNLLTTIYNNNNINISTKNSY